MLPSFKPQHLKPIQDADTSRYRRAQTAPPSLPSYPSTSMSSSSPSESLPTDPNPNSSAPSNASMESLVSHGTNDDSDFEWIESDAESIADSGYEPSGPPSIASSIIDYQFENGRRYHNYRAGKYALPNDDLVGSGEGV